MTAPEIVHQMMRHDAFSQWLGLVVRTAEPGHCVLEALVRPETQNGFGIAHGGLTYSLADSALAFASNGHGQHAVSIETSIAHLKPVSAGDLLVAEATERHRSKTLGRYDVTVRRDGVDVAHFRGTVFFKDTLWQPEAHS
jgi:acyl-CoA thioesterase